MSMSSRSRSSPFIVMRPAANLASPMSIARTTSRVALIKLSTVPAARRCDYPTRRAVSIKLISYSTMSSASALTIAECRCGCSALMQLAKRRQQRPWRRMAELHDAVALAAVPGRGHDAMDAGRQHPVGQPLEHHPGVDDHLALGSDGVDPSIADLDLQAGRSRSGQRGDQVDVAVRAGPHVGTTGRLGHRRVAERPGERGAVGGHLVEQRFVAADRLGDHPQEPALDVFDAVVEGRQQPLASRGSTASGRT